MLPPRIPRVAFFPDSFHEVNGVAHTARQFTSWAARTGKPFLCICAGARLPQHSSQGSLETLELPRGFASFALDKDLRFDPLFLRHGARIMRAVRAFQPDIVHITGPSELGMLGAALAHRLRIPLAASWHTNVHEYAAQRSAWALRVLPQSRRVGALQGIERATLRAAALLYRSARVLFAPNPALCTLLAEATGRPCLLMARGIDAQLFSPDRRTAPAPAESGTWTLGYVGRLSVEKNVSLLPRIAEDLRRRGFKSSSGSAQEIRQNAVPGRPGKIRFLIVGQGREMSALQAALPDAEFPGVLHGEALARAYANMDCFLFPSHTDTFGNAVLEALASGVPAIVTPSGGPAHIVSASGGGGIVAAEDAFGESVAALIEDPKRHACMQLRARTYAEIASWDRVFEGVYEAYGQALK